jgi:hypothetical protein
VTSIETRPNNPQAASWKISLDYGARTASPEKAKLHKLTPELPYHDIKPPPGVRVIKVEAVHVKMLLRNSPAAKVLKPVACKQNNAEPGIENLAFDEESLFCSMGFVNEEQHCPNGDAKIDDIYHMQSSTQQSDKLKLSNLITVESSCAYLTPPPSQETREERVQHSGTEPKQNASNRVSTDTIMISLETGLRHIMCKAPSRNSKSHIITSNEDFDCLPIVAPALWAPDHHKSLSERAVFLPTISHAIANVSGHGSARPGLKVKAWQLSHRYPHKGREMFSPRASLDTDQVQEALSVDLWAAMASGLSDSAKQSRIIRDLFESTRGADGPGEVEHMLDEFATDYGSNTTCDESDFEDLLDMASEADDRSICNSDVGDTGDVCSSPWTEAEAPTDHLPNRWNPEHPSCLDPDFDMFDDSTELYDNDSCGVLGPGDAEYGRSFGTHREIGQCWSGSYLDHDSEVLQLPETAGAEPDADDMLLWDL